MSALSFNLLDHGQARSPQRKSMAFCVCAPSPEHTVLAVMEDNEALYDSWYRNSIIELNRLLAQFISGVRHLFVSIER